MKTREAIHRLRILGLIEGISFLVLLVIAMPLKHIWGMPMPVKIVGWSHGLLFTAFVLLLLYAMFLARWSLKRAALIFFAALIPFGPFLIDRRIKSYANEVQ